jgi:hypothetical protein
LAHGIKLRSSPAGCRQWSEYGRAIRFRGDGLDSNKDDNNAKHGLVSGVVPGDNLMTAKWKVVMPLAAAVDP